MRIWDLVANRQPAAYCSELPFTGCHWSPDGRVLAVVDSARNIHLLRLEGV